MAAVIGLVVGFAAGWAAHVFFGPSVQRVVGAKASTTNAAIHTAKAETGWEVREEGGDRPIAEFATKAEAKEAGRAIAKESGTEHIVHKADGTVGEERQYGQTKDR